MPNVADTFYWPSGSPQLSWTDQTTLPEPPVELHYAPMMSLSLDSLLQDTVLMDRLSAELLTRLGLSAEIEKKRNHREIFDIPILSKRNERRIAR